MATRAAYFSPSEAEILMEVYEEVKEQIKMKGNTATIIKQRKKAWQNIADRLNALNMSQSPRTWQQVKIKYKNILQNVKKKAHKKDTDGGSPKADLTPTEDIASAENKCRITAGTETNTCPSQDAAGFIQVSGSTVKLEPQLPDDADPGEGTNAAAAADDDDGDETSSLDSRRHEDPEGQSQPGSVVSINASTCKIPAVLTVMRLQNSQAIKQLYAQHMRQQIQLADMDMEYKKRKLEDLALDSEIKRRTIRILDLKIKKLERELQEDDTS
ncbi:uncharacterized protein LOC129174091 isoform X1 [Dunckerocampus dactyliophorus]|uniref:uncharacterized protein LOC129174091 isoform X1 n=1 Tax=Dunckerocampus dactyliophorus TaxID=161453 RepID=UPI002404FCFF|nr:uncharacterized protein LOC129174091 isoform X1 [Dunckerocampus dactyliophorus]XP_054621667.1 uncharacterized protein LOC129174091 isoform X1 [Dunckerocampus dactyliophorus]XP_054621668.1 uncharacterized protein LOC129174091 isoform X1 [Dunckerocampus dactyliophorus]